MIRPDVDLWTDNLVAHAFDDAADMLNVVLYDSMNFVLEDGPQEITYDFLDTAWTGFRTAYARNFLFGAAALFTIADQLETLINPDKYYQVIYARIGMPKLCADCGEPDYPLDDKTGLCYTCWTLAGRESEEE